MARTVCALFIALFLAPCGGGGGDGGSRLGVVPENQTGY